MTRISAALALLALACTPQLSAQIITTVVGGTNATDGLKARDTPLVFCRGVAADRNGAIYIADDGSRTVRRIDPATGIATVFAGGGMMVDDLVPVPARDANLNLPAALAVGPDNSLYIADDANHRIRRVAPSGKITTVAGMGMAGFSGDGNLATHALLTQPLGLAVDSAGNLYFSDSAGAIRKVEAATGIMRTLAGGPSVTGTGDGIPARTARVQSPKGVAVDTNGNVFFAEPERQVVRKIEAATGLIRTVAGNGQPGTSGDGGPATAASLTMPVGVAVASNGDIFISHLDRVRKVSAATGVITTVLGGGKLLLADGRAGTDVMLQATSPSQLFVTAANALLVALPDFNLVIQLGAASGTVGIVAGSTLAVGDGGPAKSASVAQPAKLALDATGNLYIADSGHHRIRRVAPGASGTGTGAISTVAGTGVGDLTPDGGSATASAISAPEGLAIASDGTLYFTEFPSLVRRVGADGLLRTAAGGTTPGCAGDNGPATAARLLEPSALAVDGAGNLYILDAGNHRVRHVNATGIIRTIAGTGTPGSGGDGGPATAAQLSMPSDLLLDGRGGLLIADTGNNRVRRVDLATGKITTVAGAGSAQYSGDGGPATLAGLPAPLGLAIDARGNLYVAGITSLRRIDAATGTISTVAGSVEPGFSGDDGLAVLARLRTVRAVAIDTTGNLFVSDTSNHRVRRISAAVTAADLAVGPPALVFDAVEGGEAPPPRPFQIVTRNLVAASWSASIRLNAGSGWLQTGPTSGMTPGMLPVAVSTTGLAAGTYTATITITAAAASNSPQSVTVTLRVAAGGKPKLAVDRQLLIFRARTGGGNPPEQGVGVRNEGGGRLLWSTVVQTRGALNWLSVSPASGDGPAAVTVSATVGALAAGVYQGLVAFVTQPSGELVEVPVTFIIDQPSASLLLSHVGTIFIANEGASVTAPDTVQIVNTGSVEMKWQAAATALAGGDWLAVSPASGTTAAGSSSALTLTAQPAGLAAGVYGALVGVTAPGALNSPQVVMAQLVVQQAGADPVAVIRPGGLALVASAGGGTQQGSVSISTSGGAALSYVAAASTSDGAAWLSISPPGGRLQGAADSGALAVQANTAGLASGVYRGRITVSLSTGVTQDVGVLLIVTPAGAAAATAWWDSAPGAAAACTAAQQYLLHTALLNNFSLPSGWATPVLVRVLDNCGNAVSNSAVVATFTNGDDALVLGAIGSGQYSGMWNPGRTGTTSITVLATGSGLQAGRAEPISGTVSAAGAPGARGPLVYRNGAVSGASFKRYAPLAPGQIFSLFGTTLASQPASAATIPLPRSLAGLSATLGGVDLPLYYADTGQVNAQVPFDAPPGNILPLVVKTGTSASPPELVTLAGVQPGIFTVDSSGSGAGVVTDAQGSLISAANPARAGQVVIVYATGLGATQPAVATGEASPSSTLAVASSTVSAYVGGQAASVEFAGLTPGLVGLYQVNLRIPAAATSGDAVELYLEQNQVPSNKVTMAIK